MSRTRTARSALVLFVPLGLSGFIQVARAPAQDLVLDMERGAGFQCLLAMAQSGRLGDDVTNANVGVNGDRVRIELVRGGAPVKVLLLRPKRSGETAFRYFEVEPAENSAASDAALVGRALDECFAEDPFEILGVEAPADGGAGPGLLAAWSHGDWRAARRAIEGRMMVLASLQYTIAVIVVLAVGFAASLALLWGSTPAAPSAHRPL